MRKNAICRLLELCLFALIKDTELYNHDLDLETKEKLEMLILNNLNDNTDTLKKKLIKCWEES